MAEAFLFPSVYEEFGIPLCEAMACGCPIVASNTGAIPEITAGAAVVADPFDAPAMAQGIDRILKERVFRAGLVERGRQRAATFTWDRCASDALGVLDAVVRAGVGGPVDGEGRFLGAEGGVTGGAAQLERVDPLGESEPALAVGTGDYVRHGPPPR